VTRALGAAGVILLAVVPLAAPVYYVNIGSQILVAAVFALSLNLLVGHAGLTSLGHAVYLGTTAYTVAWLTTRTATGHLAAAVVALAVALVMAAFFGVLALRGSGLTYLMITLALGQILWGVAYRWAALTGGENGISGMTRPRPFGLDLAAPRTFYVFALVITALVFAAMARLVRSPLGASIEGCRDQPRRMRALGHNVWLVQWVTCLIAGAGAAVAGLLYVYYYQFVAPPVLALTSSAEALLMVIAGGAATLAGPVVGAALVVVLKSVVSAYVPRWIMLLGIVFVLIMLFMPQGLVPGLRRLWRSPSRSAI
jgi:branched-chain amino acid transport system permease protein